MTQPPSDVSVLASALRDCSSALPDGAPDQVVDACGLPCPLPLLRAKQALRSLPVGGLLQVVTTDAASVRDFQAYARISGHVLEGFDEQAGKFTYWLRKTEQITST